MEAELNPTVLKILQKENLEVQAAFSYLSDLGVTLWSDWLISDQWQRLHAARWLAKASAGVRKVRRNGNFKPY